MIFYAPDSLFTSPAQTLVNTVNTVGVMGKGVALEFKKRYPEMFRRYKAYCDHGELAVGMLYLYQSPHKWVLNFPTKQDWRKRSELSWVELGLKKFVETYRDRGITSVAFPQLGCGNGGLDWKEVAPLMVHYLKELPIPVYIHMRTNVPGFVPEHEDPQEVSNYLAPRKEVDFAMLLLDLFQRGLSETGRSPADCDLPPTVCLQLHENDGSYISFRQDELHDLWGKLKHRGSVPYDDFPGDLRAVSDLIAGKLLELPYIRETRLIGSHNTVRKALRYAPQPIPASEALVHVPRPLAPVE